MTKISVTIDAELLERVKSLHHDVDNVSAIVSRALREHVHRYEMSALLNTMEQEAPISPAGKIAGEKLWESLQSTLTPAPSVRLPIIKKRSGTRSKKR